MDNIQLDMLCRKLCDDLIPSNIEESELDRRIEDIKTRLGLLEQMLKIAGGARLHKIITIRSMIQDLFGVRGEIYSVEK